MMMMMMMMMMMVMMMMMMMGEPSSQICQAGIKGQRKKLGEVPPPLCTSYLLKSISHTLNVTEKYCSYLKLCCKVFLILKTLLESIYHTSNFAKRYSSYFELF